MIPLLLIAYPVRTGIGSNHALFAFYWFVLAWEFCGIWGKGKREHVYCCYHEYELILIVEVVGGFAWRESQS